MSPGEPLGAGQIYDSNRTTIIAALREEGVVPLDLGVAKDTYVGPIVKCRVMCDLYYHLIAVNPWSRC